MLTLYGHPFSSYTWKVLIALYANDTPFALRQVPDGDPADYAFVQAAHPAGKFPILLDGDTQLIETSAIIEHLALDHPGPAPLIPADPHEAVRMRMLDRVFDNYVMGSAQLVVNAYIANGENPDPGEIEKGKAGCRRAFAWLDRWLMDNALSPHVSLVTCAAAPALFYADWVAPIPADAPRVAALRAELLALPAVSRCVEEARPYRHYFPPGAPERD